MRSLLLTQRESVALFTDPRCKPYIVTNETEDLLAGGPFFWIFGLAVFVVEG